MANYVGLYAKALSAAAMAGFGAYVAAVQDGPGVTTAELFGIIVAFLVGLGAVWAVPNLPVGVAKYLKAGLGAAVAVASALAVGYLDGTVNVSEVYAAVFAGLGALGLVGSVSNAAESDPINASGHLVPVTRAEKSSLVNTPVV